MQAKRPHQIREQCANLYSRISLGLKAVTLISFTIAGVVIGVKQLSWLQPLELRAYDRLVRAETDRGIDSRLLIVAITEQDIRRLKRSTPADETVAAVLNNLRQHQPQVIGLDLYRDVPQQPGYEMLRERLQNDSIIVITKLGSDTDDTIPAPDGIPAERIGFNDLVIDSDGVIRRALLFGNSYSSFSLQLALNYLAERGITPIASQQDPNFMQLGAATFFPLNARSGGYQTIDDRGYQILLDYRSPERVARRVSFSDVLNNRLDPTWVRDKIVLIGTVAPSGKDLFYTPYSASEQLDHQMAGVEIHAQMVSQIIGVALGEQSLIWFWNEWLECGWVLLWALIGGSVGWYIRHPLALGLGCAAMLTGLSGIGLLLLTHQGWVPLAAPGLAGLLTTGTVVAYRAQQAQRQQQMVMTLLGQSTSPEIATALWQNRDRLLQSGKLPGQKLIATMLFTDIRGFSAISEPMPPEALLELLNVYLEAMTEEIRRHQGIVNKFTGDGLLAVFGVPVPRLTLEEVAQDASRAVSCALAMSDRLQQLNHHWQQTGTKPIQMRVGIFTGPIVAGSLGGKDRMEYGVIGDSVNIASRLEGCAKDRQISNCRILIAYETLQYIEGRFVVEPWGTMALRGKQQPVDVYRVISHATDVAQAIAPSSNLSRRKSELKSSLEAETQANSLNLLE